MKRVARRLAAVCRMLRDEVTNAGGEELADAYAQTVGFAALAGCSDAGYEEFLAAYDPKLREEAGAYYTPIEVVRAQIRLVDDLLVNLFGKPLGFADPDVITLDPAAGTGTYLLGVIEQALGRTKAEQGAGAAADRATALAANLHGFERMAGPYAAAHLRTSRALREYGAVLPEDGPHIDLTDTLDSPDAGPRVRPNLMVCLGNPPYGRHRAAGGWVRRGKPAIFQQFVEPAVSAGHGVRVHNLYNLYVYFWRWALWKVFEQDGAQGPGVVSFLSASSYVDGDAFCGMREHMRRICDEIWILDLGGEGRGTRKDDNVFAIQTPVAIAVAVRSGRAKEDEPAKVHYARLEGTRETKLAALDGIRDFQRVPWQDCAEGWQAPFRPAGKGRYFDWPLLTELMPWQHSGVKAGRTWVIAPEADALRRRWQTLMGKEAAERRELFKDSPTGRKADELRDADGRAPEIVRFAFRSFDRQFVLADARLLDRPAPALWRAHGERQVYLTSLLNHPLGRGAAVTACALIPDLHHFRGSYGAKEVFPLYRTADAGEANIVPGLLNLLGKTPEDFLAYVYGMLAQPAFTARFAQELGTRQLRVPITKDAALFERVRAIGARLLWLHTYGERFVPEEMQRNCVPRGAARCVKPVPTGTEGCPESFDYSEATATLRVGEGEFRPVSREVFEFEVSGLQVVRSWLKYRMRGGAGRTSSPLDAVRPESWTGQFTTELLELLWVLEATVAGYPEQARLLEAVVAGVLVSADELGPATAP